MTATLTNHGLKIVLTLYLLLAFGYSILVPMWEAPDETAHYLYIMILSRQDRLPTDIETYEALQPPGYYYPAAKLFDLLYAIDPSLIRPSRPPLSEIGEPTRYDWTAENYRPLWGGRILRWLNIIPGAMTLLLIFYGARRLLPDSAVPLAATALTGLNPQFLHNTAAITNDSLANMTGAFFFWLITIVVIKRPSFWRTALIVLGALLLPFVVKLTILPMSFVLLLALVWQWRERWLPYWPWLAGAGTLLGLLLVGILAVGVQDTDILIWRTIWLRATYVRPDFFSRHELWFMMESFAHGYWGRLSFRQVGIPMPLALWLTGTAVMGLAASMAFLIKDRIGLGYKLFWYGLPVLTAVLLGLLWIAGKTSDWWTIPTPALIMTYTLLALALLRQKQTGLTLEDALSVERPIWAIVWMAALLTFLVVFKNTLSTPQYQGRFFFPALGPISILMTAGWSALLPRRLVPYLPFLIMVSFILINLYVLIYQVIPIYYQPFLD